MAILGRPHHSSGGVGGVSVRITRTMYTVADAFTSQWQGHLFRTYRISSLQMMLGANVFRPRFWPSRSRPTASSITCWTLRCATLRFGRTHAGHLETHVDRALSSDDQKRCLCLCHNHGVSQRRLHRRLCAALWPRALADTVLGFVWVFTTLIVNVLRKRAGVGFLGLIIFPKSD